MFQRHSDLLRQEVEVSANGMTYKGVLVEVTDEDVKLRGKTGWIILPFHSVRRISKANAAAKGFDPLRSVGSGFYDDQMTNDAKPAATVQAAPRVTDLPPPPDLAIAPPLSEVPRDIATGDLEVLPADDPFAEPSIPPPSPDAAPMNFAAEDWAAPPILKAQPPTPTPVPKPAAAKPAAPPTRPAAPPARPAPPPPAAAKPAAPPPRPAAPPAAKPAPAPPAKPAAPPAARPGSPAPARPVTPPARPPAPPAAARPAPPPARAAPPPARPAPAPAPAPPRPSSSLGVVPAAEPPATSSVEDLFRELQIPPGGKIPSGE